MLKINVIAVAFACALIFAGPGVAQDDFYDRTEIPDTPVTTPTPDASSIQNIEEYKAIEHEGVGIHGHLEHMEKKLGQMTKTMNQNLDSLKDFKKISQEFETLKSSYDQMSKDFEEVKTQHQANLKKIEKLEKATALLVKKFPSVDDEMKKWEKNPPKPTPTPVR